MIRHEGKHNTTGYNVVDMIRSGTIPRRNFEDFPRAFLLAFQVTTVPRIQMHQRMITGATVLRQTHHRAHNICTIIVWLN